MTIRHCAFGVSDVFECLSCAAMETPDVGQLSSVPASSEMPLVVETVSPPAATQSQPGAAMGDKIVAETTVATQPSTGASSMEETLGVNPTTGMIILDY